METNNRNCENCNFFVKHYFKHTTGFFKYLGCGHCEHISQLKKVMRHNYSFTIQPACQYWEKRQPKPDVRLQKIQQFTQDTLNNLNEITYLLYNEE